MTSPVSQPLQLHVHSKGLWLGIWNIWTLFALLRFVLFERRRQCYLPACVSEALNVACHSASAFHAAALHEQRFINDKGSLL